MNAISANTAAGTPVCLNSAAQIVQMMKLPHMPPVVSRNKGRRPNLSMKKHIVSAVRKLSILRILTSKVDFEAVWKGIFAVLWNKNHEERSYRMRTQEILRNLYEH